MAYKTLSACVNVHVIALYQPKQASRECEIRTKHLTNRQWNNYAANYSDRYLDFYQSYLFHSILNSNYLIQLNNILSC